MSKLFQWRMPPNKGTDGPLTAALQAIRPKEIMGDGHSASMTKGPSRPGGPRLVARAEWHAP